MTLCRLKYTGPALPEDAEEIALFDTTIAFPGANYLQMSGSKRLYLDLKHDQAVTFNWYKPKTSVSGVSGRPRTSTEDTGLNDWEQIGTSGSVSAPASDATTTYDWNVEPYSDFLLMVVIGAEDQTVFIPDMVLTDERSVAT